MEDKDKFADEMLSDDELDKVAGGNPGLVAALSLTNKRLIKQAKKAAEEQKAATEQPKVETENDTNKYVDPLDPSIDWWHRL